MFLRMLVHQFIRQFAHQKVQDELASRMSSDSPGTVESNENTESAPVIRQPAEVAILFALGVEANEMVDRLDDRVTSRRNSLLEHTGTLAGRPILIAETGVGRKHALKAMDELLSIHNPQWIVSAGFAAALAPHVRRGQILMPDHVLDASGNQLGVGFQIDPEVVQSTKGLLVGPLVTVDHLVRTSAEKESLGKQFSALGCDMETYAVAESCRRHQARFLAVRVISDALDDSLSPEVEALMVQSSLAGKIGAAAGAILQRPAVVKDMWRLKEEATKASTRLARFLEGVLPQLK